LGAWRRFLINELETSAALLALTGWKVARPNRALLFAAVGNIVAEQTLTFAMPVKANTKCKTSSFRIGSFRS
jgi:hypothetical protein